MKVESNSGKKMKNKRFRWYDNSDIASTQNTQNKFQVVPAYNIDSSNTTNIHKTKWIKVENKARDNAMRETLALFAYKTSLVTEYYQLYSGKVSSYYRHFRSA